LFLLVISPWAANDFMSSNLRELNLCTKRLVKANGPAIWGGCVTRRRHRHKSVPVGYKAVPVQGGYGVVFAIPVQC
jgi:hypothetical protein